MKLLKLMVITGILFVLLVLAGCSGSHSGNSTAKDILKDDNTADIIQVGDLVYSKGSPQSASEPIKGMKIGEIKKRTTSTLFFQSFYASQLLEGTEVFFSNGDYNREDTIYILVVELDGELIEYHALLEG
ncbi:Uncharacterised protein [Lysinibacillus sphaericus]|nr:Uncharacterised protein [Lysinibacillus sphaericus]